MLALDASTLDTIAPLALYTAIGATSSLSTLITPSAPYTLTLLVSTPSTPVSMLPTVADFAVSSRIVPLLTTIPSNTYQPDFVIF